MHTTPAVRLDVDTSVATVWEVLDDGWSYASWVVGASRIREVEPNWPAVGSRIHHSFGPWPLVIDDHTVVLEVERHRRLRLKARGWPTGEAEVEIVTEDTGSGRTRLSIAEDVVGGPALLIPKPLRQAMITPRNRETLRRVALLALGRAGRTSSSSDHV